MDANSAAASGHHAQAIADLMTCQTVDPQRGPFHVKASPCRSPKFKQGRRVYADAFGNMFTIRDGDHA